MTLCLWHQTGVSTLHVTMLSHTSRCQRSTRKEICIKSYLPAMPYPHSNLKMSNANLLLLCMTIKSLSRTKTICQIADLTGWQSLLDWNAAWCLLGLPFQASDCKFELNVERELWPWSRIEVWEIEEWENISEEHYWFVVTVLMGNYYFQ